MIKYIVRSGSLYSDKHGLLKTVECPLQKTWDELQRIDHDIDPYFLEPHSHADRQRYCDCCRSKVFSINGLTESEIAGACMANPETCLHATLPHPAIEIDDEGTDTKRCPYTDTELRVIHTARYLTAMNDAVEKGFCLLIRPVIPDETIGVKMEVWQDEFGKVITSGDYRSMGPIGSKTYWHNPYISPLPFAAYLVPPDIEVGERVYLVDLIEDRPGRVWNQGDSWREDASEATWTGETFELDPCAPLAILG